MFLRPQHFQQMERSLEMLIESRTAFVNSHAWGFSSIQIDRESLQTGRIAIKQATGIFPDGTPFSIPDEYPAPAPLEIGAQVKDATVLLAIPARRAGLAEFSLGDDADTTLIRYVGTDCQVADAVSDMPESAEMKLGRLNLRCLLEGPAREEGFCTLGMVRVVERRSTGQLVLDESYIPPALQCRGLPRLQEFAEEVRNLIRHRAEVLAGRLNQSAQSNAGEISELLMLQAANRVRAVLNHAAQSERLHPEALYALLGQIAGEFATFSNVFKFCARDYPAYRHDDLRASFEPLMQDIRVLLTEVLNPNAVQIQLHERVKGWYTGQVPELELLRSAMFVLVANADVPAELLRQRLPVQVKIGPPEKIRDLVMSQLPGIALSPLSMAPPRLPFYAGHSYFELDRRGDLWKMLEATRMLALHIAGEFPRLQLELWALRP